MLRAFLIEFGISSLVTGKGFAQMQNKERKKSMRQIKFECMQENETTLLRYRTVSIISDV